MCDMAFLHYDPFPVAGKTHCYATGSEHLNAILGTRIPSARPSDLGLKTNF